MPIDRVTQLEQALEYAREMIAELERKRDHAEQVWMQAYQELQAENAFLKSCVAGGVVQQSKRVQ